MLIDRVHELNEEVEKNEKAILDQSLSTTNQETKDELESCIIERLEEENQDNLRYLRWQKNKGESPFFNCKM